MEQLGTGLSTPESKTAFYNDFLQMENIIQRKNYTSPLQSFLPPGADLPVEIVEDEILYHQQLELSHILETAASCEEAMNALKRSSLAHFEWETEKWAPYMIETAIRIAQKWKK